MEKQINLEKTFLALIEFLLYSKGDIASIAEKYDLTPIQAVTILLIDKSKPMHYFTKLYHCDASNTTGIIDGLERKKLVNRLESKKDRRVKTIELTKIGTKKRSKIFAEFTSSDNMMIKNLDDTELQTFLQLIEKIKR